MYKIDQNRTVRRKIEVEGETVEVDETCFWDASAAAAAAASASDVTTGALIIRQTDEINARETTFVRYVEKGADIEDESTAVDEQASLSHSRIYTESLDLRKICALASFSRVRIPTGGGRSDIVAS